MRIITRAEWGARPFVRPRTRVPITSRRYFVAHYPGAGTPPKDVRDYAKWLERIHIDQNGWSGVGYNYFISHGEVAEGCGRDIIGSHSPPRNRDGIGVNIWTSNGVPLEEDLALARQLYDQLSDEANRALIKSYHGKDYPTECPGPIIRRWVQAGMPYPQGHNTPTAAPEPSKPQDPLEEIMSWYKDKQSFEVRLSEIVTKYVPRATFWSGTKDTKGKKIMINTATAFRWSHKIGRETRKVAQEARKVARDNRIKNTRTEGKINGITEAVKELAKQQGADTARIEQLIKQGVDDVKGEIDELSKGDDTINDDESDTRELIALMADTNLDD